ncbi:MAG TPA: hypothetical protein VIM55_20170 [Mucilaginibacter sp.]
MKYLFLILIICLFNTSSQNPATSQFISSFKLLKLDAKYEIKGFLKPSNLSADFNGDGKPDAAMLVIEKKTKKKGIMLIQGGGTRYFVFGAGTKFGDGGDNYSWLNGWQVYKEKIAYETVLDKNGDLADGKKVVLKRPALYVYQLEDGEPNSGGIIYWDGKKYIWIQQGE